MSACFLASRLRVRLGLPPFPLAHKASFACPAAACPLRVFLLFMPWRLRPYVTQATVTLPSNLSVITSSLFCKKIVKHLSPRTELAQKRNSADVDSRLRPRV